MGLDSLAAVDLRNRLSSKFGVALPATLAFDYPTASSLAAHIASLLGTLPGKTQARGSPSGDGLIPSLRRGKSVGIGSGVLLRGKSVGLGSGPLRSTRSMAAGSGVITSTRSMGLGSQNVFASLPGTLSGVSLPTRVVLTAFSGSYPAKKTGATLFLTIPWKGMPAIESR